jgi:hypothetical protein
MENKTVALILELWKNSGVNTRIMENKTVALTLEFWKSKQWR